MTTKWEYVTELIEVTGWFEARVDGDKITAALNRMGDDGWELVSAFDLNELHGRSSGIVALFKRPRR